MNDLQVFNNVEFGSVRSLLINGEPYFVGKDVAGILGYSNSRKALIDHVDDEDKNTVTIRDGIPGNPNLTVINESGLYSLILSSKLPSAKRFKRWVTSEVLPAIRRREMFTLDDIRDRPEALIAALTRYKDEQDRRMAAEAKSARLEVLTQIQAPKAEYFDDLVERNLLTNFRDTAKALGVKQRKFIDFLLEHNFVYRDQKGSLMPKANKKSEGLFEVKQCTNTKTKWAGVQTLITPKGVETFRLLCQGL